MHRTWIGSKLHPPVTFEQKSYSLCGMDVDSLAERVLLDLKNTFNKDPLIDEFDILPVDDSICNKCPVVHTEHKVALESWCVKHVYLYAYRNLMKWRQHLCKIDFSILLSWTGVVLLINPDVQTAWNVRKELIDCKLQHIKDELKFTEVVLSRKPKSSEVFAHRKWVLLEFMKCQPSECSSLETVKHELFVCTQIAHRYSNNYYAWSHRKWVIQEMVKNCLKAIREELEATKEWVSAHVSDHSGFHYRQFLISYFKNHHASYSACSRITCSFHCDSSFYTESPFHCGVEKSHQSNQGSVIIIMELELINDLINLFPGHETLWNHRRFVIREIIQLTSPINCHVAFKNTGTGYCASEDSICHKKYKLESCSSNQNWCLAKEEKFIMHHFQNANSNWEKKIIQRYISWLKRNKILMDWSFLVVSDI